MRHLPYYILGLGLFAILYLEPTYVGGVKVSHLWKAGALYLLSMAVLFRLRWNRKITELAPAASCRTIRAGYLMCLWIVTAGLFHNTPSLSLVMAAQRLFPLLVLHYIVVRIATNQQQLQRWIIFSVLFTALSTIPFHLGLLEPLGKGYDVVALLGAQRSGFVGIFQNQHVASFTLAISALLAAVYSLEAASSVKQRLVASVIAVLLCYSMLLTYARAGYAALLLGGMSYLVLTGRITTVFRMVILGIVAIFSISLLIPEMDVLKSRIMGKTRYSEQRALDMSSFGSGRLLFWNACWDIIAEEKPAAWLAGIGEDTLEERMEQRLGIRIFAHNGFVNELLVSGAVGLLALLYFLRAIYQDICKIREASMRRIGQSLFVAWLAFIFFQGGEFPVQYVLLFLFVAFGVTAQQGAAIPYGFQRFHETAAHH